MIEDAVADKAKPLGIPKDDLAKREIPTRRSCRRMIRQGCSTS
jgi:hypothetical protein